MAVIRDRITVVPPDGETVSVDIKQSGVSIGTAHAERTTSRTLTLPLSISERTSFFVPVSGAPYSVSVKLGDVEIAGDDAPVTVSSFPAEIRASIDTTELTGVVGGSSGGSVPTPAGPGDALKFVRATAEGDGLELAVSPIGNKADYSNSSPSITVATGGLPRYITAAELPDLLLEPDPGALPAMETDGSVVFPDGALLLATAFVSGEYDVAPLVGSDVFAVALGGNAIEILADTANTILPTADGTTTSFSVAKSALVAIPPGGQIGSMFVTNSDPNELTLTFVEFMIRRAA